METLQCIELKTRGPRVSFDARLGRNIPKGRVLDFSERQFRTLCQEVDPSSPDVADHAQILVTTEPINGSYDAKTGVIKVEYSGSMRQANTDLRHETSHYIDDYKNGQTSHVYYRLTKHLYRAGFWLRSSALVAGAICANVYVINDIENTELPKYFYEAVQAVGAVGVGGVLMRLSYRLHPEELRANRAASKRYLNPLSLRYAFEYS